MKHPSILGLSGIEHTFAVSLFADGAVAFAIEEDKLRRFRGLGLRHLKSLGSRAIDQALSRVKDGIRGIEGVAYVSGAEAGAAQVDEERAFVSGFLQRHYGFSPPVTAVDHISAHLAFEHAVHGNPDHVLYAGRSRVVYSHSGSASYDFDGGFTAVYLVQCCAEFLGLDQNRIHHLENIARFGKPRFFEALQSLLAGGFDPACVNQTLEAVTGGPQLYSGDSFKEVHFDLAASLHGLLRRKVSDLLHSIPPEREPAQSRFPAASFRAGV